jgi:hypothetical protein
MVIYLELPDLIQFHVARMRSTGTTEQAYELCLKESGVSVRIDARSGRCEAEPLDHRRNGALLWI